jgi:uridine kinase
VTVAATQIIAAIRGWQAQATPPLVVAIDGHGAAGKTTLAAEVAGELDAALLHTDDYFQAASPTTDLRPMAQYYDWSRLRDEGLARALKAGANLILVEGVSAAAPAIADLVNHTVFVATPEAVRVERLHGRITPEEWDEAWLAAERAYFAARPPESFDLIVSGSIQDPQDTKITN